MSARVTFRAGECERRVSLSILHQGHVTDSIRLPNVSLDDATTFNISDDVFNCTDPTTSGTLKSQIKANLLVQAPYERREPIFYVR